jgi:tetratricopeptide (TPR) repeat protein
MKRSILICLAGAAMLCPSLLPAAATTSTSVIGSSHARACFDAAESRRRTRDALRVCDSALMDAALPAEHRAATLVNRGIIHMQAGKIPAAIVDFDAAIVLQPVTAEAYVNKGIALIQMGGHDSEAVALLTKGLDLGPMRPEVAHYTRAIAYESLGKVREAFEDYSRAAQLAPQWPEPGEQLMRFQRIRAKTLGA